MNESLNLMFPLPNQSANHSPSLHGSISPKVELVEVVIVAIFLAVSVVGNIFIIIVKSCRQPSQQSLITNRSCTIAMSFADVLSIVLALCDTVKAVAYSVIEYPLPVHRLLCSNMQKIILAAFSVSNLVTLLLTSVRYRAVCYPLAVTTRYGHANKIVLFVILAVHAMVFVSDDLFVYQSAATDSNMLNCYPVRRSLRMDALVSVEITVLGLSVTLSSIVMAFYLYRIFKEFSKGSAISSEPQKRRERNVRAVKILISMYVAYMTSFVPWVVFYLIGVLNQPAYVTVMLHPARVLFVIFIAGSFCNSFLTYLRYSGSFRNDLSLLLRCNTRSPRPRPPKTSSAR